VHDWMRAGRRGVSREGSLLVGVAVRVLWPRRVPPAAEKATCASGVVQPEHGGADAVRLEGCVAREQQLPRSATGRHGLVAEPPRAGEVGLDAHLRRRRRMCSRGGGWWAVSGRPRCSAGAV